MEDLIYKYLLTYGPLGLGWVVAFFLWRANREDGKKLFDAYVVTASTMAAIRQLLDDRLPRKDG